MSKLIFSLLVLSILMLSQHLLHADGKVIRPRDYHGSLEESAQEAIILFERGDENTSAVEDLILKISVTGNTNHFAWVVPFPNVPKTTEESGQLFAELFKYCERRSEPPRNFGYKAADTPAKSTAKPVEVLRSQVVGSYQVDTVREQQAGTLNQWLADNKYQPLENAEDILDFYRRKNYVFTCIRVSDAALTGARPIDLHPLRFHFKTGGRDGIYFPMRLTSLQQARFNLNLYIFTSSWLNDKLNVYGYVQQGLKLRFRDFDTPTCVANAGKWYAEPKQDSYLRDYAAQLTETAKFFRQISPQGRFYLTNIQAYDIEPAKLRYQPDDLWLFPHYNNPEFVPFDARGKGIARAAYAHVRYPESTTDEIDDNRYGPLKWFAGGATAMMVIMVFALKAFSRRPPEDILNRPLDD